MQMLITFNSLKYLLCLQKTEHLWVTKGINSNLECFYHLVLMMIRLVCDGIKMIKLSYLKSFKSFSKLAFQNIKVKNQLKSNQNKDLR